MPTSAPIEQLIAVMARLRDPEHGCPWDVEQTFASIAPYTVEEAYEVADAIARDDIADLKDELGDLLFAVVNLARHLSIQPEEALRKANRKFEKRFRSIETEPDFASLSLEEKEALWVLAKADQAGSSD